MIETRRLFDLTFTLNFIVRGTGMIQLCDKVLFAVPKVLKVSMVGVGLGGDFKREIILSIKLYSSMETKISFVSFHY